MAVGALGVTITFMSFAVAGQVLPFAIDHLRLYSPGNRFFISNDAELGFVRIRPEGPDTNCQVPTCPAGGTFPARVVESTPQASNWSVPAFESPAAAETFTSTTAVLKLQELENL